MKQYCYVLLMLITLVLTGCGGGSSDNNDGGDITPPVTPPDPGTEPPTPEPPTPEPPPNPVVKAPPVETTLWGDSLPFRRWENGYSNDIQKVQSRDDGTLCYLILREQEQSQRWPIESVECIDAEGTVVFQISSTEDDIIKDILISPSGDLYITTLTDAHDESREWGYFLRISQFDRQWQKVEEAILVDSEEPGESAIYDTEDGVLTIEPFNKSLDGKPLILSSGYASLYWANNHLHLLAYSYGIKLYRLDQSLTPVWATQVMPQHSALSIFGLSPGTDVTFDEHGNAYVAFDLYLDEYRYYEIHFGQEWEKQVEPSNKLDLGVVRVSNSGEHLTGYFVGIPDYSEYLVSIEYQNGSLWLASNASVKKFDRENDTLEWDIQLYEINAMDGQYLRHHLLDIEGDDRVSSFALTPDGDFLLSGVIGFHQFDSNSWTRDGKGLLAKVDTQGVITTMKTLENPRNVVINDAIQMSNGSIHFGGIFDGPLTHTCDDDLEEMKMCYYKAMLGEWVNP